MRSIFVLISVGDDAINQLEEVWWPISLAKNSAIDQLLVTFGIFGANGCAGKVLF